MKLLQALKVGATVALTSIFITTGVSAMGTKPATNTLILSCTVENPEHAPEYAAAICPAFAEAAAAKWSDKTVVMAVEFPPADAQADMLLELRVEIRSESSVQANMRWNTPADWATNGPVVGEPLNFVVTDTTLRARMVSSIIHDLLRFNGPFAQ